jgi:hypothetical protein
MRQLSAGHTFMPVYPGALRLARHSPKISESDGAAGSDASQEQVL